MYIRPCTILEERVLDQTFTTMDCEVTNPASLGSSATALFAPVEV